jgi:hypothetical protein
MIDDENATKSVTFSVLALSQATVLELSLDINRHDQRKNVCVNRNSSANIFDPDNDSIADWRLVSLPTFVGTDRKGVMICAELGSMLCPFEPVMLNCPA